MLEPNERQHAEAHTFQKQKETDFWDTQNTQWETRKRRVGTDRTLRDTEGQTETEQWGQTEQRTDGNRHVDTGYKVIPRDRQKQSSGDRQSTKWYPGTDRNRYVETEHKVIPRDRQKQSSGDRQDKGHTETYVLGQTEHKLIPRKRRKQTCGDRQNTKWYTGTHRNRAVGTGSDLGSWSSCLTKL